MSRIDALVLAGGENRRFPSQKAFARVRGKRIIDIIVDLLRSLFRNIYISTNNPEEFFPLGMPMIGDLLPCRGPMNGIYSALRATGGAALCVVACDSPLLQRGVLELLCSSYAGQDALVPIFEKRVQPLPGIYNARIAPVMETHALSGRFGLRELLGRISAFTVAEDEIYAIDPAGMSFMSINTPEDYARVCGIALREAAGPHVETACN